MNSVLHTLSWLFRRGRSGFAAAFLLLGIFLLLLASPANPGAAAIAPHAARPASLSEYHAVYLPLAWQGESPTHCDFYRDLNSYRHPHIHCDFHTYLHAYVHRDPHTHRYAYAHRHLHTYRGANAYIDAHHRTRLPARNGVVLAAG